MGQEVVTRSASKYWARSEGSEWAGGRICWACFKFLGGQADAAARKKEAAVFDFQGACCKGDVERKKKKKKKKKGQDKQNR